MKHKNESSFFFMDILFHCLKVIVLKLVFCAFPLVNIERVKYTDHRQESVYICFFIKYKTFSYAYVSLTDFAAT